MKYRKKPVIIEAIQFIGTNSQEIFDFTNNGKFRVLKWDGFNFLQIETLEGIMKVLVNDWIIKGVKGEFYPCKPDVFELTYEEVND